MNDQPDKSILVRFPGSKRLAERLSFSPDTSPPDVFDALELDPADYSLGSLTNPDRTFDHGARLFDELEDDDVIAAFPRLA